ncbi:MAG: hypothetical protein ACREE5_08795 [Acetobacteraceae bacterium]
MRRIALAFIPVLLLFLCRPVPAAAQSDAMSFAAWRDTTGVAWGEGVRKFIFASGGITPGTPAALSAAITRYGAGPGTILVLNSPGGDLDAGLAMGRIIRSKGLWTEVGTQVPMALGLTPNLSPAYFPYVHSGNTPPFPGYCYSSCTVAFLGGVVRTVGYTSDYGVHRFYFEGQQQPSGAEAVAMGEDGMAEIAHYVKEMGVDPDFMQEMAKKGPNAVTHLSEQRMAQLNITTPFWHTNWSIQEGDGGVFYYDGTTEDASGKHDDVFVSCGDKQELAAGHAVLMAIYVDPAGRVDAASFVPGITNYNLRLDQFGQIFQSSDKAIVRRAFVSQSSGRIGVTLGFTLNQFSLITGSRYLGFAFYNPNNAVNFFGTTMTIDQDGLDRFARRCLPPADTDFTLTNVGSEPLKIVQTRVAGAAKFGTNVLSASLAPNAKAKITMPHYRGCQFDLLMAYADRSVVGQYNVNLCAFGGLSVDSPSARGSAPSTNLAIKNAGNAPITAIYITPNSDKYWGSNLLAGNDLQHPPTIVAGATDHFPIAVSQTCQFDMKVQFTGGAVMQMTNQNLCYFDQLGFAGPP